MTTATAQPNPLDVLAGALADLFKRAAEKIGADVRADNARLLDFDEVAVRLNLGGAQTVRDHLRTGDLPFEPVHIGRRQFVRSVDVDRFLIGAGS